MHYISDKVVCALGTACSCDGIDVRAALFAVWSITYFAVWKGVKSVGVAVKVTVVRLGGYY